MWSARSDVQAGVELVVNPVFGVIHKSMPAAYPWPRLSGLFLLPVRMGVVDICGLALIQRLMPPFIIVVADKVIDSLAESFWCFILLNVDIFPFNSSKKPFCNGVIESPTFTVHTYLNAVLF